MCSRKTEIVCALQTLKQPNQADPEASEFEIEGLQHHVFVKVIWAERMPRLSFQTIEFVTIQVVMRGLYTSSRSKLALM